MRTARTAKAIRRGSLRRRGLAVSVTCAPACAALVELRAGGRRIAWVRLRADGTRQVRVRARVRASRALTLRVVFDGGMRRSAAVRVR